MLSKKVFSALEQIGSVLKEGEEGKVYLDLKEKMESKFEGLGIQMLHFVFGRLKMYFLL
jgi:hypothetical protein